MLYESRVSISWNANVGIFWTQIVCNENWNKIKIEKIEIGKFEEI